MNEVQALEAIRAYHRGTCHYFMRYARGPGELYWLNTERLELARFELP